VLVPCANPLLFRFPGRFERFQVFGSDTVTFTDPDCRQFLFPYPGPNGYNLYAVSFCDLLTGQVFFQFFNLPSVACTAAPYRVDYIILRFDCVVNRFLMFYSIRFFK